MNVDQMRFVDSYAGAAACALLTAWHKLTRPFAREPEAVGDVRRILVTKYLGMGSILLATPMVRELRRSLPGCRVELQTFAANAAFAEQLGIFDEVHAIRTSRIAHFVRDVLASIVRNRQARFDVVCDLEFFARFSTILSYLSGARVRIGYYLPKLWRGDLLTHPIHFNPYRHVTEVFAAQLGPLGLKAEDLTLHPPAVLEEDAAHVARLLSDSGATAGEFLFAVNVNASDLSLERRWPKERFVGLIEEVARRRPDARIVLVGSRGEAAYVGSVRAALAPAARERTIDLAGQLTIGELVALLARSGIFVTSDSGPLHLASALGVPTLSFFGPETPTLYGPVGSANTVLYAGIYCSPCLNVYNAKRAMCRGNNVCMQALGLGEVVAALEKAGVLP